MKLQAGFHGPRVHAVVLNGVGGAHHLGVLQTGNGVDKRQLHILRQGGGQPLQVHFFRLFAARLHKQLVPFPIGEAHHLVLKAGAVSRAFALNFATVHRTAVQVV